MPLTHEERQERRKAYKLKWYAANRVQVIARTSAYAKAHPEMRRRVSREWYDRNRERERIRAQRKNWRNFPIPTRPEPLVCECCGVKNEKRALSLDHCHATGAFRGWLCSICNMGIGKLGDTIEGLQKAIDYLKRSQQ